MQSLSCDILLNDREDSDTFKHSLFLVCAIKNLYYIFQTQFALTIDDSVLLYYDFLYVLLPKLEW